MIDFWIFPLSTIWGAYHNLGIGFVPEEFAEEEKKAGNVFEIEVEEKLPTRNIILIYDTEYPQSIASKEFQKFLSSQKN